MNLSMKLREKYIFSKVCMKGNILNQNANTTSLSQVNVNVFQKKFNIFVRGGTGTFNELMSLPVDN